ncbi:dTDP-4-dehydrorhamnose reductase [Myroides sp. M-43]|uniref:dTDP-4-dehydrorhamnose reductase n=1 Tax=Myroides oncorhynchi TaxID=2893756 RepID=UPI001E3E34EE|nr:dTDP-4-dehydrorhamnose reductase [Myroides oncorhynchi]MCC9042096.1 dTDP-4-dehydrorhamnose reductase [Myroides oncorhynchi]
MIKVLVTGAKGQTGQCLQSIANEYSDMEFVFLNSKELDLTNANQIEEVFSNQQPDYCINLAAYTAVDKAEDEVELAYKVNASAVLSLAEMCTKYRVTLVHISTDFIFGGEKNTPYTISDIPNPINVYGASKLKGEEYIKASLEKFYIVRTSWVYSDYGHNFKNTMLRLAQTRDEISVVNDQIGSPTHAVDLCHFILILVRENKAYGVYNYRGSVICTWYDFAISIFKESSIDIKVNPISTEEYPTKARRPRYSVLEL